MSPHRGLCGFFLTMNLSGCSFRLSKSESFSRKVFFASVFVISSCFPSFSVSLQASHTDRSKVRRR